MLETNNSFAGSLLPIVYKNILEELSPNQFAILDYAKHHYELRLSDSFIKLDWKREEIEHLESRRLIKELIEIESDFSGDFGTSNRLIGKNKHQDVYILTELGRLIQEMKP